MCDYLCVVMWLVAAQGWNGIDFKPCFMLRQIKFPFFMVSYRIKLSLEDKINSTES